MLAGSLGLAGFSVLHWQRERAEIRRRIACPAPSREPGLTRIRRALRYLREHVPYARPDDSYLLPVFGFLKPTALQVLRHGGDCAYRARALIVILDIFDIEAKKLALYDEEGTPVHAVVLARTRRGNCVVDPLYNFVHVSRDGDPLPLEALTDDGVLAASVARQVRRGNRRARRYPLSKYRFHDVRTYNWKKSKLLTHLYDALVSVWGKRKVDRLPRPIFFESPALMVAGGATAFACGWTLLLLVLRILSRRFRRRLPAGAASPRIRAGS